MQGGGIQFVFGTAEGQTSACDSFIIYVIWAPHEFKVVIFGSPCGTQGLAYLQGLIRFGLAEVKIYRIARR